jgi:hypothetical protein
LSKVSHLSLAMFLILTVTAWAQEPGDHETPDDLPDAVQLRAPSPPAGFFNVTNDLLLASSAVTLALDGVTTQRLFTFTSAGKPFNDEANPILRLSQSRTWTALYFAGAFAGETGAMYYLHRRASRPRAHWVWRVAEKTLPVAVTLVEIKVFMGNIQAIHRAECVSRYPVVDGSPNPCL